LTGQTTGTSVTVTQYWKTGTGVEAGLVVRTDYAELFFPAEGYKNPSVGFGATSSYWTSSPTYRMEAHSEKPKGLVESSPSDFEYSIRLVKDLPSNN